MAITKRATNPPRTPKTRVDLPLSHAWKFTLLTGELPTARLAGWVVQAQDAVRHADGTSSYDDEGDRLWLQHSETLIAEAASHGFTAYWSAKQTPTGPGFQAWLTAFLAEHRY